MIAKFKLVLVLLFVPILIIAQNMTSGFKYLEDGDFAKAEIFFEKVLKEYPNNITAKICYARAIGLNKNEKEALKLFIALKKENPENLEINLNYAESLLWNKQFEQAKKTYSNIILDNPTNFNAYLGLANSLSNLKEYENALINVNKALSLKDQDPNALTTRKYIKLGLANSKIANKEYKEAERIYDEILTDFENDTETLQNKANLYLITKELEKAEVVFSIIELENPIISLNGFSLLAHLNNKNTKALRFADQAINKLKESTDKNLIIQTKERYAQALIWNKKYRKAQENLNLLKLEYPNENRIKALFATLYMYKSDFKKSINKYEEILASDPLSFDGNLGIASAYYAEGNIQKSYRTAYNSLSNFKNNNDILNFIANIDKENTPFLDEKFSFTFDNGKNTAYSSLTQITFPISTKWSFSTRFHDRKTKNTSTDISANTFDFSVGANYKFLPNCSYTLDAGLNNATSNSKTQVLINTFFKIKSLKLQDLEFGFKREMLNYNSELIRKEIAANNYYINYSVNSNINLGWFTQYYYTNQTDNNVRNLLFTSLYYNFLSKPILKGGLNYQYMSFKDRVPSDYFSPERFNAGEVFVELFKDENTTKEKNWFYKINSATGFQYIEDNDKQWTYRVQATIGYIFTNRLICNLYGNRSNIASATASGFTFTETGIRLKWLLAEKPIFNIITN